ncbi:MAG: cupin domain-containing protein [Planctomycetota bacterium]|jgi:uncharacterized RmlC-like cupin family protein
MSDQTPDVEHLSGLHTVRKHPNCRGWNGIHYRAGLSAGNTPATQLSMNVATIPPGGVAKAHIHDGFDLMLYILEGEVRHEYGERLEKTLINTAGDFIYIEPGVPHEVFNCSDTDPVVAVVARAAADEWDRIIDFKRPG